MKIIENKILEMKTNRKKLLVLTGFFLFTATLMFAGSNEKGIDYYRAELYEAAKLFFLQQTDQSDLEKAENYYYLGQIYNELNKLDSASYYYKKAIEISPLYPFGYVGEGMIALKAGNKKAAEEFFKKAGNLAKKNPSVQTAIAEIYVDAGDNINALLALEKARKINTKYSGIYIVEGDMSMKQGKVGEADGRYGQAISFNKNEKLAYLKSAQIYKNVNTKVALDYLGKLLAIDPEYIPAYALLGDIYYKIVRNYNRALDAYEKFIVIPGVPLEQHESYAQLLYFTKQYQKALDEIKYVLSRDPDNLVMKRLEAYNSFRMENYELGFEQMNKFLEIMPVDRHIYLDYMTLFQLAVNLKNTEVALEALSKAIEKDPEKAKEDNLYREKALVSYNARMFQEAIKYFEEYFEIEKTPQPSDFLNYAKANYFMAVPYIQPDKIAAITAAEEREKHEAELKNYVKKGDNAYVELIKLLPNIHVGYMGRANIHELLDGYYSNATKKWESIAKPFYEEALTFLLNNNEDGARNKEIIEVYHYFNNCFIEVKDTASVIEYSKKILQLDPNNERARNNLKQLNVKF